MEGIYRKLNKSRFGRYYTFYAADDYKKIAEKIAPKSF